MPCWYFDKQDLVNTPSLRDGIDTDTESRYRREGARFLMDCGNSMGLRYDTMATGVVFFHRFFMYHSFNEFPRYVMATCCLFLAGKVEETPKKCKDIIKAAKTYLESKNMKKHLDSFGEDPIKEIMTYEKILLQTIKFDLQVDHPYGYLVKYAKSLKGDQNQIRSMVQMAWAFINDSYCTTLCLQWEPEIIAIALMYLTSKLSKFEITDWIDKKDSTCKQNWWDQFVEGLGLDILEDICHQILDLYATQQQQQSKSTNSNSSQINKQNANNLNGNGLNNSQNNINFSNKRKSPPDSLSLTPNSTLSSVGYNEQASPTSAKLIKTFNESNNHPPPPPPPLTPQQQQQPPSSFNPGPYQLGHHYFHNNSTNYQAPPPPPSMNNLNNQTDQPYQHHHHFLNQHPMPPGIYAPIPANQPPPPPSSSHPPYHHHHNSHTHHQQPPPPPPTGHHFNYYTQQQPPPPPPSNAHQQIPMVQSQYVPIPNASIYSAQMPSSLPPSSASISSTSNSNINKPVNSSNSHHQHHHSHHQPPPPPSAPSSSHSSSSHHGHPHHQHHNHQMSTYGSSMENINQFNNSNMYHTHHMYNQVSTFNTKEQSHVNNTNTNNNSSNDQQRGKQQPYVSSNQLRSSALKTVNISDRPI